MTAGRLVYSEAFNTDSYRLIELPNDILADLKNNPNKRAYKNLIGHSLVIKGRPEDEAVLCTDHHTYSVKLAISSNTLLLVPPFAADGGDGDDGTLPVATSISSHYELTLAAPRLHTLKGLLEPTTYTGLDNEDKIDNSKLYTFQQLTQRVQASAAELREKLSDFNAIQLNGHWRLLGTDFVTQCIDLVLTNIVAQGWSMDNVEEAALASEMSDYDPKVLSHILQTVGTNQQGKWELNLTKVSIFRATQLLRDLLGDQSTSQKHKALDLNSLGTGKDWKTSDFLSTWQDSVPDGAPVDVGLLKGIAVTVKIGAEDFVRYLPADNVKNMPDPRDRIRIPDFEPYLSDVAKDTPTLEQLLVKNARPLMQEGVRVYSSRD